MNKRPIGMFDSGVGGLTVLKEIRKELPNEEIIYLGDTKNFPYGSKSKESIIEISIKCCDFLISKNVKLIIIACGTVTSQAIDTLQKHFSIPIIGIINPTVDYLYNNNKNPNETIGIIATSGTIKSEKWEEMIKLKIPSIKIINKETPLLATIAEQGWNNNKIAKNIIKEYMKNFKKINKLILGCTHYPIFEELIKKELNKHIEIINPGIIVAKYVKNFIKENSIENDSTIKDFKINITDYSNNFIVIADNFLKEKTNNKITLVNLY